MLVKGGIRALSPLGYPIKAWGGLWGEIEPFCTILQLFFPLEFAAFKTVKMGCWLVKMGCLLVKWGIRPPVTIKVPY